MKVRRPPLGLPCPSDTPTFFPGAKVTWADRTPGEEPWLEEQRAKWRAMFGPGPYTVRFTADFRLGEPMVYPMEFFRVEGSAFEKPTVKSPRRARRSWKNGPRVVMVKEYGGRGLIASWFKVAPT